MKKILFGCLLLVSTLAVTAQPPAGEAKPGEWYGEKITGENAVPIADIPAKLESNATLDTKVRAKVLDVCSKKGCWIKLAVNDSTTAFVKMKDYGFFLPVAAKGKTVVIDGQVQMKTISVAELQHYAGTQRNRKKRLRPSQNPKRKYA